MKGYTFQIQSPQNKLVSSFKLRTEIRSQTLKLSYQPQDCSPFSKFKVSDCTDEN